MLFLPEDISPAQRASLKKKMPPGLKIQWMPPGLKIQ